MAGALAAASAGDVACLARRPGLRQPRSTWLRVALTGGVVEKGRVDGRMREVGADELVRADLVRVAGIRRVGGEKNCRTIEPTMLGEDAMALKVVDDLEARWWFDASKRRDPEIFPGHVFLVVGTFRCEAPRITCRRIRLPPVATQEDP